MAIILATTDPTANREGDQISVTFKSGDETVTLALSLNQSLALDHSLRRASIAVLEEAQARPVPACAQLIAFPSHLVRRA